MSACTTPEKKAYPTKATAIVGAHAIGVAYQSPYLCACGKWHLTSRKRVSDEVPAEVVEVLKRASDKEFVSLARAEAHGKATPDEAAALRSPELRVRWAGALREIATDMQRTMMAAAYRDDETTRRWRKKQAARILQVSARRKEAKLLLAQDNAEQHARARAQTEAFGKRKNAGRRAVARLIDAHREEFETYLAEEKAQYDEADDQGSEAG